MNRLLKIITGVGAGVAAAYFLDPKKGSDRRASIMDKFNSFKNDPSGTISEITEGIRGQAKNYGNDAKGLINKTSGKSDFGQSGLNQPNQSTH